MDEHGRTDDPRALGGARHGPRGHGGHGTPGDGYEAAEDGCTAAEDGDTAPGDPGDGDSPADPGDGAAPAGRDGAHADTGTTTGGAPPGDPPARKRARHSAGTPRSSPPPTPGDARRRDALLLDAGHSLTEADSLDDVLRAASRLYSPEFPLDGQVVFGVTEKFLYVLGQYGFRNYLADRTFRMPMTTGYPAVEVARTGAPVFLTSIEEYRGRFPATWQLAVRKDRCAWAFMPLTTAGRITGVWLATFRTRMAFSAEERHLLTLTARLLGTAIERTRTSDAELALSHGVRRSMGTAGPSLTGLGVATRYVPTGGGLTVGGDWYDVIDLPSGRLALVIGDVQGHDVHAAGLMAQLRTAVHAYAAEGHGPDAVLSRTSRFLHALDDDRFATCIYIEADPETGVLQIARAGHPHPVLRLPDGTCLLKHVRGGLPLGLMEGEDTYPVNELPLQDDEILMLCTDGLIESGGHDMFSGWVRLRDALTPGPTEDIEAMADRLLEAVINAPEEGQGPLPVRDGDDIALLLLRREPGGTGRVAAGRRLLLSIEQDQAEGVAEAREELKGLLYDWERPDQVETAILLASELLGNVLVHTDQAAVLAAEASGEPGRRRLLVEVTDRGDELPHQRVPGEMASSGRGLMLLDILSDEWGVRPEPEGKTVWFVLDEGGTDDKGGADGGSGAAQESMFQKLLDQEPKEQEPKEQEPKEQDQGEGNASAGPAT
ncbi:SpoIIE family protein phosphatase [Streptomyces tsukubensis]|nr:SpoIIE family protein phosphatase [Streptomyces tsukubensis]